MLIIPDVSKWDLPVDFTTMKEAGADGVYIKASQANYADPQFLNYWAAAKAVGLLRGAYHFLDSSNLSALSGQKQSEFFLSMLAKDPGELPPALDCEYQAVFPLTTPRTYYPIPVDGINHIQDFVSNVQDVLKKTPAIYTGVGFWGDETAKGTNPLWKDAYWKQFQLWVANWGVTKPAIPAPWTSYFLWQFTNMGGSAKYGASGTEFDLSRYEGTLDELNKFCGTAIPVPVKTIEQRVASLEQRVRMLEQGVR